MRGARTLAAGALACLVPFVAAAGEQVICHYNYGGEDGVLATAPVASPYDVAPISVGSYFKFRVVFQAQPADRAAIKIYTYADRDDGAVPIHQASYRYPPPPDGGTGYGFSGRQFVYEPVLDGELQYWCVLQATPGDKR